jgi:Nif-specific regulatory protein
VQRALLVLREPEGDGLRVLASRNREAGASSDEVPASRTILDRSAREGAALLLDDALADAAMKSRASVVNLGLRSVLCVPIPVGGRPAGALYADNRARRSSFTADDLAYLRLLGRMAGIVLENLDHAERLEARNRALAEALGGGPGLVSASAAMEPVLRAARLVAATDATVLLTGESGTGKELLAETTHLMSKRRAGPCVEVNCAAIPDTLLEAELFGLAPRSGVAGAPPEGRAGRFERAHGGTLFLDEVGDLGPSSQARILRALEERRVDRVGGDGPVAVDLRVVAATNKDLDAEVKAGRFRSDLLFRLRVVEIRIPPLRERPEDVVPLAEHFLRRFGAPPGTLAPEAARALLAHGWPGNVRELRNVVERALVFAEGGRVEPRHLPFDAPPGPGPAADGIPTLEEVEREHVRRVLDRTGGNVTEAARLLGIARNTLYARMERFGIEVPRPSPPSGS